MAYETVLKTSLRNLQPWMARFLAIALMGFSIFPVLRATAVESGESVSDETAKRDSVAKEVAKSHTPAEYEADWAAFAKEVDTAYPFFDLKGNRGGWDKTKAILSAKVKACGSDTEFLGIVIQAIRSLRDAHMGVRDQKCPMPEWPKFYYPDLSFMPATQNRVIIMFAGKRYEGKLKPGTVVSKIDGKDARRVLEERAKEAWTALDDPFTGSSPQRARLFTYRIPLRGPQGEKHTLHYLADGQEQELSLTCDVEARGWPHVYNMPPGLTNDSKRLFYGKLVSGAGYMYLRDVTQNTESGMRKAIEVAPDAKGWIIDLRGNGGGGYNEKLIEQVKALPKPVVVLIDAGCMSAGETLARDIAKLADARVMGAKTAGASSSKRQWKFPSGIASVTFAERSRVRNDGKPIEFNGIEPDIEIEAVPEEVAKGLNSEICRAEDYLKNPAPKP